MAKLSLLYDRAGRSEGIAFVTYESAQDAKRAIREFDGANANGKYWNRAFTSMILISSRSTYPTDSCANWSRSTKKSL